MTKDGMKSEPSRMLSTRLKVRASRYATFLSVFSALTAWPDYIKYVLNFLNGDPAYDKADYRLFRHSTFLSEHQPSWPALDYQGAEIKDENQQPVPISTIPLYKQELAKHAGSKPWWAGELTGLKGYFFTDFGGNYCYNDGLGVTTDIMPLRQNADDDAEPEDLVIN